MQVTITTTTGDRPRTRKINAAPTTDGVPARLVARPGPCLSKLVLAGAWRAAPHEGVFTVALFGSDEHQWCVGVMELGMASRVKSAMALGRRARQWVEPPNWKYPSSSPLATWSRTSPAALVTGGPLRLRLPARRPTGSGRFVVPVAEAALAFFLGSLVGSRFAGRVAALGEYGGAVG